VLRIAVVSDLHAYDEHDGDGAPSHLKITDPEDQPGQNPIAGLSSLIKKEKLKADVLLCPGDLGHKARPAAIKYAWHALQKLKSILGAGFMGVTAGNHDLDSRYQYNKFDAKGLLQSLDPPYPMENESDNDRYWSRNFLVLTRPDFNILILNSSAYHGGDADEINHGRISDATLASIERRLASLERRPINLLLCHHHPQQHMELDLGDFDVMKNGQLLLDLLGREADRWLVIHGHKHHPKLTYASGGATSPIIFSAGSLSASLYQKLAARVRNQFYVADLPIPPLGSSPLVGVIRAWDWAPGLGWEPAGTSSGLPALSGFGYRGDPAELAQRIRAALPADKSRWSEIRQGIPEVDYLLPQDFQILRKALALFDIVIQDINGLPYEIGVRL
jgi:hypothetical protein